jgi:hypothetical protein
MFSDGIRNLIRWGPNNIYYIIPLMSHNRIKMLHVYKIIIKNNFQYSEYKSVLICYRHERRQKRSKQELHIFFKLCSTTVFYEIKVIRCHLCNLIFTNFLIIFIEERKCSFNASRMSRVWTKQGYNIYIYIYIYINW